MVILILLTCFDSIGEVGKIELNETPKLKQLIFWEWNDEYRRFEVVAWREVKTLLDHPTKTSRGWEVSWYDRGRREWVTVYSRIFRHTKTLNDPERANTKLLPEGKRMALLSEVCTPMR